MFELSRDSSLAEQQVRAFTFALVAFGYIDGELDQSERDFILGELAGLARQRSRLAPPSVNKDGASAFGAQHLALFDQYDAVVRGHFTESVSEGERHETFVVNRLKLGCLELMGRLEPPLRRAIVEAVEQLMHADGRVHPSEAAFLNEVSALLGTEVELGEDDLEEDQDEKAEVAKVRILPPSTAHPTGALDHPVLRALERSFSADPARFAEERDGEIARITRVEERLRSLRSRGTGALARAATMEHVAPGPRVLDGRVYVQRPIAAQRHELLVLGDLHGCYSCLKGALLQFDFFEKLRRHELDPAHEPEVTVVFLGDYIDRGTFSYAGTLRAALALFSEYPRNVVMLRGNHEHYLELGGRVVAPVRPCEALESLAGMDGLPLLKAYRRLFEDLPTSFLFDRVLFAHGGIPRDATFESKWRGLKTLNDPEVAFEMLWSDPGDVDAVPRELQHEVARFGFGRRQFSRFMKTLGCTVMVRGHERVTEGMRITYDDPQATLLTLFSAGGEENLDLPPTSNYRAVRPMALKISHGDGATEFAPFPIDYRAFNDPERNRFFASEIAGVAQR